MAPVIPLIPAILAFGGTIVQAATQKTPKIPEPRRLQVDDVDDELRDAQKRKGRQVLAGSPDMSPLTGGQIGADRTFGSQETLIGGA